MNTSLANPVVERICKEYGLEFLKARIDLTALAKSWGVTSVETSKISALAMLLSDSAGVEYRGGPHTGERMAETMPPLDSARKGYKIILQDTGHSKLSTRQRFSFAHELGHLLLKNSDSERSIDTKKTEEQICDQIAAEILMPRADFQKHRRLGRVDTDKFGAAGWQI